MKSVRKIDRVILKWRDREWNLICPCYQANRWFSSIFDRRYYSLSVRTPLEINDILYVNYSPTYISLLIDITADDKYSFFHSVVVVVVFLLNQSNNKSFRNDRARKKKINTPFKPVMPYVRNTYVMYIILPYQQWNWNRLIDELLLFVSSFFHFLSLIHRFNLFFFSFIWQKKEMKKRSGSWLLL